ncbi:MAG: acetyl-CoA carboxylase carboxyltransferase subunit alpha [Alphaproteobacteria bacterium]|nr:acetyl-CoA carboxylase carboxyltransferase subunit alpha [Alphaproteobacteria bacterium]
MQILDFEKPVAEMEAKLAELQHQSGDRVADEVARIQQKTDRLLRQIYGRLTPAQKVQVARHPNRPHCMDYVKGLMDDFVSLSGDRLFADDAAMVAGLARFRGTPVAVLGQERGNDTESRLKHNFGMARPEGYRKAQRVMHLAGRFNLPIISFVDTAGAFPGIDAEARGQAEAIAKSIETCLRAPVPIIAVVIGEGGSGGAIAIATADKVLMLEHSIYSVISPEGCASILWRSAAQAAEAATALRITAQDLLALGLIDGVIPEPIGGAQRRRDETIALTGDAVAAALSDVAGQDSTTLQNNRAQKFLAMGHRGLN